jgi:predicted AlkP superfamily phosphohydrolase/phosphomutase
MLRETVRLLFRMAERIVRDCADESTVVCVVSDHGNLPKSRVDLPDVMLYQKGWLVLEGFDERQRPVVDSKRSKARAGAHGVWLNVRGREKHGCVEPGEEYEALRTEMIEALRAMRDTETGECPFALVGRREDFAGMGMHGERVEDIVFFPRERNFHMSDMNLFFTHRDFYEKGITGISLDEAIRYNLVWDLTAVHWGLPEASVGYASNRPVFLLCGPGVKRGARGDRRVNLVDVAPTLAHILGIEPPSRAEGRIVREALVG